MNLPPTDDDREETPLRTVFIGDEESDDDEENERNVEAVEEVYDGEPAPRTSQEEDTDETSVDAPVLLLNFHSCPAAGDGRNIW